MVNIDELCKELSADDAFSVAAMREAIEKVRTLNRPEVETELVLIYLAKEIGNAKRGIIGMVASIEGRQSARNTK